MPSSGPSRGNSWKGAIVQRADLDVVNDGPEKAVQIWSVTGRRPILAAGNSDGDLVGLRYDNWKFVFAEQRAQGTVQIWAEPFVFLRIPKIFNLRTDPFERADITSNT